MSLLTKAGISKLSELEIDAAPEVAKDIVELILTSRGDILYRNVEAARLGIDYGSGYNFLKVQNTGHDQPCWIDLQALIIYLTGAVNRMIAPPTLAILMPEVDLVVDESHAGGGFAESPPELAVPVPAISEPTVEETTVNACFAVAHDQDGADADETTEANEATANDMTLLQADGAVLDWYALGYADLFDGVVLKIGTVGADITLDTFEYSKAAGAWGTLVPIMNQLNNYETLGKRWFTFERPGDWAVQTLAGVADKYWIRLKSSATGAGYDQPKGDQAWILVY